jgi:hypothetical protein
MGGIAQFVRYFVIALAGAQTAYWLYTSPIGDDMEFVAIVPFGFIFLALVVPSLMLALGAGCSLLPRRSR